MKDQPDQHVDADRVPLALAAALRRLGMAMPETVAEVAAAEEWLKQHPVALPPAILDPKAVLRGPRRFELRRVQNADQAGETLEHLARAAREGGVISEEIEERMRQDRERKKRERGEP
jgi:hypothetical protein